MNTVRTASILTIASLTAFAGASVTQSGDAQFLTFETASTPQELIIDISGIASWDGPGSLNNVIQQYDLGAGTTITGIGWDVEITTVGASWLSEPIWGFSSSEGEGVSIAPGAGFDSNNGNVPMRFASGDMMDGAILDLIGLGLEFELGADGLLTLEFFESYDDILDEVDAFFKENSFITVQYKVPAPGSMAILGLGGLVANRRRRA